MAKNAIRSAYFVALLESEVPYTTTVVEQAQFAMGALPANCRPAAEFLLECYLRPPHAKAGILKLQTAVKTVMSHTEPILQTMTASPKAGSEPVLALSVPQP